MIPFLSLILIGVSACTPSANDELKPTTPNPEETKLTTKTNSDGSTEITGKTNSGENFSMTTKNSLNYEEFGLKEYPRTNQNESEKQHNVIETATGKSITVTFTTKDSITQATDFYEPQLTPKNRSVTKTGDGTIIGGETSTGAKIAVIISKLGSDTQVSISGAMEKK
ncbi:MAG: hypothetical protein ACKVQS_04455 [Fimbriimonadaceae bacterium]